MKLFLMRNLIIAACFVCINKSFAQFTRITSHEANEYHAKWHPIDKNIVLYTINYGSTKSIIMHELDSGAETEVPLDRQGDLHFDITNDGNYLIFDTYTNNSSPPYSLYLYNFGSNQLTNFADDSGYPSFSPDGKKAAFLYNRNVYTANLDGSDLKNVTNYSTDYEIIDWSPDGSKIAFASYKSGNSDIWIINSDGTGLEQITNNTGRDYWPSWSPDGKKIAYTSVQSGNYDIWIVDLITNEHSQITTHPNVDNQADWSADGTSLIFSSTRNGSFDIWIKKIANEKNFVFPLSVGNKWQYQGNSNYLVDAVCRKDTIQSNGQQYNNLEIHQYSNIHSGHKYHEYYRQEDNSVFIFDGVINKEYKIFDFSAEVGDTITNIIYEDGMTLIVTLTSKEDIDLFGTSRESWKFRSRILEVTDGSQSFSIVDSIGIVERSGFPYIEKLTGALIDNDIFGTITYADKPFNIFNKFRLNQNYPNPFNPITTINYRIGAQAGGGMSKVSLKIYDLLGCELATLVNREQSSGDYEVRFDASELCSGIYIYQLNAGKFSESKKMMLIK